jgi:hypothetical protein
MKNKEEVLGEKQIVEAVLFKNLFGEISDYI